MKSSNIENLAEQIAAILRDGSARDESGLRSAIEAINERLDRIESRVGSNAVPADEKPQFAHASLQRFSSLGEIADVILDRINNQKECPYEPAGKPCDNCSMCSSRGF